MTTRTFARSITVMGSPSVGKSALVLRFVEDRFNDDYIPTIVRTHTRDLTHNGSLYKLTILDTAGLETYSSIPTNYITNSNGYVLVYSITDKQSFETIQDIYNRLISEAHSKRIPIVLVGNKSDLNGDRCVETSEGEELAKSWRAPFIETSAKVNDKVKDIFTSCLNAIDPDSHVQKPQHREQQKKPGENNNSCVIS